MLWVALTGWAAEPSPPAGPAPLESIGAIRRLTLNQFSNQIPVRIRGTVTFGAPSQGDYVDGFLHDGREGIYFTGLASASPRLRVGDRIEVEGTAEPGGFAPMVWFQRISALGTNALPQPRRIPIRQLLTQPDDCNWVETSGSIELSIDSPGGSTDLILESQGDLMIARVPTESLQALGTNRVGSQLRLRGAVSGVFSAQRKMVALRLFVPNTESVEILAWELGDPASQTPVPIGSLFSFKPDATPQDRPLVMGIVTALRSPSEYFVQDESGALLVSHHLIPPHPNLKVQPGDRLKLRGKLELTGFQPVLVLPQVSKEGRSPLPPARPATPEQLASGEVSGLRVELEAVVRHQQESSPDSPGVISCTVSNIALRVINQMILDKLPELPPGTRVRVRGTFLHLSLSVVFKTEPSLELYLAGAKDLEVISYPFIWTARHVALFSGGLGLTCALALGWGFTLRRQVRSRTRQLELINSLLQTEANSQQTDLAAKAEALKQSEQRLSLVLEATDDGFWDWNCQTNECFYGRSWYTMLGYEPSELPPCLNSWESLLHPDDRERVLAGTERLLTGEIARLIMEYRLRHKDGSWVWVLDRGQVVSRDANGLPLRAVGAHANVTNVHRLTVVLGLVLEAGQIGFWDCQVKDQTQTWGGHWSLLLGYQPGEMPRTNAGFVELIHPDDRGMVWQNYLQFLTKQDAVFESEFRVRARDGSWHWVFARARVVERDVQGQPVRVIGIHLDAERGKQVEELLRQQAAELAESNAALRQAAQTQSEFLANMSHELRTPLTSILALSEVLLEAVHGPVNPRQADTIRSIEKSGRHLQELINEVLDVAQLNSGRTRLLLEPCPTADMAQAVGSLLEAQAARKQLTFEILPGPAEVRVQADPLRLKQILVNLVGNAVKFTPQGGKVTLRVESSPDAVCFRVIDTGIGIPAEKLEEIFQPFVQLDSGLSRKHGGSGLGLVIAKRFTELQGGSLEVASTVGEGSCFAVTFPRADHPPTAPLPPAMAVPSPAGGRA